MINNLYCIFAKVTELIDMLNLMMKKEHEMFAKSRDHEMFAVSAY